MAKNHCENILIKALTWTIYKQWIQVWFKYISKENGLGKAKMRHKPYPGLSSSLISHHDDVGFYLSNMKKEK